MDGRIWTSAGDGVHCYDPDGTLIGTVLLPERVANLTFGGPKRNRLFISRHDVAVLGAGRGERREDVLNGAGREKPGKLSSAAEDALLGLTSWGDGDWLPFGCWTSSRLKYRASEATEAISGTKCLLL